MIQLYDGGAYVLNGTEIIADTAEGASILAGKLGNVPEKEGKSSALQPLLS